VRRLAVIARAPSAAGKTRLTNGLAPHDAVALRAALLLDTLDVAHATGEPLAVYFTPADARDELARLVPGAVLVPQPEADLGARMHHAFVTLVGTGADRVVLIGSDVPTLPPSHVRQAFVELDAGADLVLGPAGDGGYYLIGLREPRPTLFDDISWGTSRVFDQTRARAEAAQLRVARVAGWHDVDTKADLDRVARAVASRGVRTRQWAADREKRA
jgi:rSAM/selenodomain-associated transferase 1